MMNRRSFGQALAAGATAAVAPSTMLLAADSPQPTAGAAEPSLETATLSTAPASEPVCIADFRALAKTKLPRPTFEFVETGSADEVTLRENTAAFARLKLLPPLLSGVSNTSLKTTVLGQPVDLPILLAPVAAQRMYHPQGALAAARAAAAMHTVFGVSSSATNSIEEIAQAANGPKWYQLYMPRDRQIAERLVARAEAAGYKALVLTVDLGEWKDADRRNRFMLPRDMLLKHLRDIGFDGVRDDWTEADVVKFNASAWDLTFSWEIFDWLRARTKLPLVIKGVLRTDDARRAVDAGVQGIVVSNHGGRRLDTMPATIDRLPHIVEAISGKVEVFLDGGIRRGTDVLKALALGARAVLIGRPYAYGLAADGEAGVKRVLELLRDELENGLIACGCRSVADVPASLVLRQ
ncbi:MAG: alpha-hydroxy acid oxidase [Pirellulales bacterium]